MSKRRFTGDTDTPCPLTDLPPEMALCGRCPYFRGASSIAGQPSTSWNICCNWPRNGSSIAIERPGWDVPIPAYIRAAFANDPEA